MYKHERKQIELSSLRKPLLFIQCAHPYQCLPVLNYPYPSLSIPPHPYVSLPIVYYKYCQITESGTNGSLSVRVQRTVSLVWQDQI